MLFSKEDASAIVKDLNAIETNQRPAVVCEYQSP
jgi:hypothetical protein